MVAFLCSVKTANLYGKLLTLLNLQLYVLSYGVPFMASSSSYTSSLLLTELLELAILFPIFKIHTLSETAKNALNHEIGIDVK